jgi:PAS domain S-box-containing protein
VKRSLREKMVFAPQDLLVDPPFAGLDLITCRNLLIYLNPDAVKRVLHLLHGSLRIGGYLFLGRGEALPPQLKGFEAVSGRWRIYRKIGPLTGIEVSFPKGLERGWHSTLVPANAHRAAVEHFNWPSVLIDGHFHVLRVYGEMDTFLRIPAGEPTLNLLDLAKTGLGPEIKDTVARALAEGTPVSVNGLWDSRADGHGLSLRVTPLQIGGDRTPRLLVSFIREAGQASDGIGNGALRSSHSNSGDTRAWSEAVRISHEELEASREELQALNQELKASNEQLNVANEDLNLANARLREKIAELEMQSTVLSSGGVMTLFLDEELRVRWFTPGVSALFPLRPGDAGRWITDLKQRFEDEAFISDVEAVMQTEEGRESEVCNLEGQWFLRRIRPHLSSAGNATGVAVTFTDITARKRAEEALRLSEGRLARELEDTRQLQKISGLLIEEGKIEGVYEEILDTAMAIMRASFGSIQMLDAERRQLRLLAWRNFHPESAAHWQTVSVATGTTCGSALQHGERIIVPDVRNLGSEDTESLRQYQRSGILAVQSTPLTTRDGDLIGMISTHWGEVHTPDERDLRLFDILVRQAADFFERLLRTAEALRESEEKYRTLFETMDEGFLIGKLIRDENGHVLDYNILEFNPAFERISGIRANSSGRLCSEVLPKIDRVWLDHCERVADTGRSKRFDFFSEAVQRWFDVILFPYGRDHIAALCDEITGRKRAETELQSRNEELERFNKVTVGRELRMIELKKEVNVLRGQRGEPARYPLEYENYNDSNVK